MNIKKTLVIAFLSLIVFVSLVYLFKIDISNYLQDKKLSAKDEIYAVIIHDLSFSIEESDPIDLYALQFFTNGLPISNYIAVDKEKIAVTKDGKLVVALFDGNNPDLEDPIYIAEVVEDSKMSSVKDNPKRPPFTGYVMYRGIPCIYDKDRIEECTGLETLVLSWGPPDGSIHPLWYESEALGPVYYLQEIQNPNVAVRLHVPIDRSTVVGIANDEKIGPQKVDTSVKNKPVYPTEYDGESKPD